MSPLLQSKAYSMVCPQPGEADIRPDGADSRFDPTRTQADPVARPLSARADIRAQTATSGGDPSRTWPAQDFRSAKALFVPSLYRGIVLSIAWTRPPTRGSHGNPHWTAESHCHACQRCGCEAVCGARAAGRTAHWLAHEWCPDRAHLPLLGGHFCQDAADARLARWPKPSPRYSLERQ